MIRWMAVLLGTLLAWPMPATCQNYLVIVSGISGEPKYKERFEGLALRLRTAAIERYGISAERVTLLAETAALPGASGRSTKAAVESHLSRLAASVEPTARVIVTLIGHGGGGDGTSRFQLPGPDMTAEDFATLLDRFATQEIVFLNLSSGSGGFIPVLSGPRRTIVTATKSAMERNETIFPIHFVAALVEDGADVDKDGRVSILEAYDFARAEVVKAYTQENQLQTEHSLLDDDGDGKGTAEPAAGGPEGALASRAFLAELRPAVVAAGDSVLADLLRQQQAIEGDLARLRARKDQMAPDMYERELERLLLAGARVGRAIRDRQERKP